jgi:hypothetical protein
MVGEDECESPHVNADETDKEAQDTCLALDDDLDSDVNNITIEEVDCIFMTMVHPVDTQHFCKGNLTDLRRILHLSLAKGNPK